MSDETQNNKEAEQLVYVPLNREVAAPTFETEAQQIQTYEPTEQSAENIVEPHHETQDKTTQQVPRALDTALENVHQSAQIDELSKDVAKKSKRASLSELYAAYNSHLIRNTILVIFGFPVVMILIDSLITLVNLQDVAKAFEAFYTSVYAVLFYAALINLIVVLIKRRKKR